MNKNSELKSLFVLARQHHTENGTQTSKQTFSLNEIIVKSTQRPRVDFKAVTTTHPRHT